MIKTIIFDLNQTIVTYDNQYKLNEEFLRYFKVNVDEFEKIKRKNFKSYILGEISQEELHLLVLEELKIDKSNLQKSIYLDNSRFELIEGIKEILGNLSQKYNLILLAGDGKESLYFKLNEFGLKDYFSKIYCSCFEKLRKCDKEIYERVLIKEKLISNETLIIDDHKEFMTMAKEFGMKTINFTSVENLKKELIENNIYI